MRRCAAGRGQATVEFAMVAIVLIGLLLAVIDLARAGFMQHNLDGAASDLAHALVTLTGTNNSGNLNSYSPTALDPSVPPATTGVPAALAHAVAVANGDINATPPLTVTGPTRLSNGQITVTATPSLSAPTEITVSVTATFTPVVSLYLGTGTMHLTASSSALTALSQS